MFPRSLEFEKFNSFSWKSPNKDFEEKNHRPSFYGNNSLFSGKRNININRSNSMKCESIYKSNNRNTRPILESFTENSGKYSKMERNRSYLSNDFDMIEEDNDLNTNDSNTSRFTNDAPDFLFGPLSSRVPKRRNILSIDDEATSKRSNTVKFDLHGTRECNKFSGPPLRQLGESTILPHNSRSPLNNIKDTDAMNFNQMSDEEFEKHCWLTVFGSSEESEKNVLKHLIDNIGTVKSIARNNTNNYFFVRMANPLLVKKACNMSPYFYDDKEIIGFTKPLSYNFLDNPNYNFENILMENEKEDTIVPKKPTVRVVSINKKNLSLRDEIKPKENGFISKIWNYVNN
ncbi:Hypothetical protein SRAE_X000224700 [Strongyloides ratti]|uniref:Nucleoporin NUP35 n=1 Tax=Strongyloides ratti TaxID=34506 RepID=A0A090MQQ7_STRRB|nr:Hypothetical protein SRAE_X000224700 [Strongyloides ratti]CEF60508.1 Hypothetical protein SRAE_X000224700 [Strongyloides ratti]